MHFNIEKVVLESGLHIYHVLQPSNDISIIANITTGNVLEPEHLSGASHLIEHMLFKGTQKRASRSSIYQELGLLGGHYFCHTDFFNLPLGLRAVLEDFEPAMELISDLFYFSRLDKEELEKEKQIVIDELQTNRIDDTETYLWDLYYSTLFEGTPLARKQGGSIASVKNLAYNDLLAFYRQTFTPANTTLFTAGPKKLSEVVRAVSKYFSSFC